MEELYACGREILPVEELYPCGREILPVEGLYPSGMALSPEKKNENPKYEMGILKKYKIKFLNQTKNKN